MARNRKLQSTSLRLGAALKAMVLCLFVATAGLGYVWQKHQIYRLADSIRKKEARLENERRMGKGLQNQLDWHTSPQWLEKHARDMKLVAPSPEMVLRLPEPEVPGGVSTGVATVGTSATSGGAVLANH